MPRHASSRGIRLLVVLSALILVCETVAAEDPKKTDPTMDADLLEFLGSVDSGADAQATADDGSWIEYLEQTDIGQVAKAARQNDPPASGDKKDD